MKYINGTKVKFTGKSEFLHGAMCYEYEIIEGHKKGKFGWTYNKLD